MATLKKRIEKFEQAEGVRLTTIIIGCGLSDSSPLAEGWKNGDQSRRHWRPHDGETDEDFQARVQAEARAAGLNYVIFDGLAEI